jgi:GAF domain-containing protein
MNKQTNISKSIIFTSFVVFVLTRFVGDTVLFILDKLDNNSMYIWQIVTCMSIMIITCFYLFYENIRKEPESTSIKNKDYFNDIARLLVMLTSILVIQFFLPSTITSYLIKTKLISLLMINITPVLIIYSACFSVKFVYKWLNVKKHKKTRAQIRVVFILMTLSIVTEYLRYTTDTQIFKILTIFLYLTSFVLIFLTAKNNSWIAYLPKGQKFNLLWLSLASLILSTWLTIFCLSRDTNLHSVLYVFSPELNTLCGALVFLSVPYLLRIFFATIGSLPTSDIVERRTYEIQSLTYLNRVVAETIDIKNLIDTVTKLALNASGANSSWFETYSQEDGTIINSSQFINEDKIKNMHSQNSFAALLEELRKPLLIESIPEQEKLYPFRNKSFSAKSLIAIPLSVSGGKFGTLVVLHDEEFGFDTDDLNVLTAFGNNVNIALENARLLVESLEKERFKRELLLAKDMQYKLLPQS